MMCDYAKWKRKELWTIYEGAWIVAGAEPPNGGDLFKAFNKSPGHAAQEIYDHAKDAIDKGKLKHYGSRMGAWPNVRVDPADFLSWLKQKGGYTIPSKLSELASAAEKPLKPKERDNLHRIIGALYQFIAGDAGKQKHPDFENQTKLIELLVHKYQGIPGLSERELQGVFAESKKKLLASR